MLVGSVVSLGMGLLFGTLSGIGAYQLSYDENNYTLLLCTLFDISLALDLILAQDVETFIIITNSINITNLFLF